MSRKSTSDARREFADVVNQVAYGGERVVLHRHGKDVAALVPMGDVQLLEALENRVDLEEALRILADPSEEWASLDEVRAELGL